MSEQQFKQIIRSDEARYTIGVPIVMLSYALSQDRKTGEMYAQIVFSSVCDERTGELVVDLLCKDANGKDVKGVAGYVYDVRNFNRN